MKNYVYETMYILRPDLNDEAIDATIGKYQTMLKDQGASILETQHRGKRRLAYEIDRNREGIYIQMNYTSPGSAIAPPGARHAPQRRGDSVSDRQARIR